MHVNLQTAKRDSAIPPFAIHVQVFGRYDEPYYIVVVTNASSCSLTETATGSQFLRSPSTCIRESPKKDAS